MVNYYPIPITGLLIIQFEFQGLVAIKRNIKNQETQLLYFPPYHHTERDLSVYKFNFCAVCFGFLMGDMPQESNTAINRVDLQENYLAVI